MSRFDLHRKHPSACLHAVGPDASSTKTLLLSLSTIAGTKISNLPWVNFHSAPTVMGQTVLWYKAPKRAAGIIYRMLSHETKGLGYIPPMRKGKVSAGTGQAVFSVEGFDGCGPVAARKLLEHFRSVYAVVNASVEDLLAVKGIGPKKAQALYDGWHYQISDGERIADLQHC
jgi:ERCC4-type nuclease